MNKVRLGLIGLGNIGQHHYGYLTAGKVSRVELVAVCRTSAAKLDAYQGLKTFTNAEEMIRSGSVDAVLIATPHFQHTSLGITAMKQGVHVMVEKPISAHKADAERLIAAHKQNPKVVFAAMFQLRAESRYQKIKQLIESGELGKVVRMSWIMTDWFRTEAYYASGGWRATWKGEGGGVLLNQCLHNLDAMQWLLGMPARVRGFAQLGRFHDIEVEDSVSAYLEYPNGATGMFVSSTGETPGTNRFEIIGTRGKLVLEREKISFTRNEEDMLEFSKSTKLGFARPDVWNVEIPFENKPNLHAVLMQNFVNAILDGEPLVCPGEEGIHSVELANVILYSSLIGETVELPMDSAAFEKRLKELIAGSTMEKKVVVIEGEDIAKSFRR